MQRELRAQHLIHSCELRRQRLEAGRRVGASRLAHRGVDLPQRGHGADHALVKLRELGKRHRRERRVDLVFGRPGPSADGRQLTGRDVDVAKAEGAVLTTADEWQSPEPVHDGHWIGEAAQRVSPTMASSSTSG